MIKNLIISILAISNAYAMPAPPAYQIPGMEICMEKFEHHGCQIILNEDGYIEDVVSGERVFLQVEQQTTLDDYTLFKSGEHYVLEHSNTTSSKNWDALVFSYQSHVIRATKYISMARSVSDKGTSWSGQECRGNVILDLALSPFQSAFALLCNGAKVARSAPEHPKSVISMAEFGLVVQLPAYDKNKDIWSTVTYVFASVDLPDASAMLCLDGCSFDPRERHFGGRVGRFFWIDMSLNAHPDGSVSGTYFYIKNNIPIKVSGSLKSNKLDLLEFDDMRPFATANFTGRNYGNSYVGVWSSLGGLKMKNFILAIRPY